MKMNRKQNVIIICLFLLWIPFTMQAESNRTILIDSMKSCDQIIMKEYVEVAIMAHQQKDMKILKEFWSIPDYNKYTCGTFSCINTPPKITLWETSFSKQFKRAKSLQCDINNMEIVQHPLIKGVYGLSLDLSLTIDKYSERGYMFMIWDFRNPDAPQIHVRTWQPEYIDKIKGKKLNPDDVYTLADFNI